MAPGLSRLIKAEWETAILVCAKCSKRLDGGFGKKRKQSLGKALRRYLGAKLRRKSRVGIVEVKCLGVCPRGAVTLVDARTPGAWRIVPAGTDVADIVASLALDGGADAAAPPAP